jgi:hypothetical protein
VNIDTINLADGSLVKTTPVRVYVAILDGPAKGMEITTLVDTLARFIGEEVLPPFEEFFK